VVHVAACILYFIARQEGFDERHTWIGANAGLFEDKNTIQRCAARGRPAAAAAAGVPRPSAAPALAPGRPT
jgi:hypothetical protein